ncbi:MAG: hypothetical protein WCP57_07830 [Bacteroidota bacterium]
MLRNIVFIFFIYACCSCNSLNKKTRGDDHFYNAIRTYDLNSIPIIPPFYASSSKPGEWYITGAKELIVQSPNRVGDIPIKSFGVSNNFIYGLTEHANYFLFNIKTQLYVEYDSESELYETLKKYKLELYPIKSCEQYYHDLQVSKKGYWFPKEGCKYPIYKDFRPDSCYRIKVYGVDKVTDFKVIDLPKRTVSKMYYFKLIYDNDENDLYYISFENSTPKLIHNNEIYTATSMDTNTISISVYTPYPVAEKKGMKENDRIVITKNIEIR